MGGSKTRIDIPFGLECPVIVAGRFSYRPEPPTPSAAPFDDGLVEIAQLITREESTATD
jgi:hypothetical protein